MSRGFSPRLATTTIAPRFQASRRPSYSKPHIPTEGTTSYHSNIWTASEAQPVADPQLERVIRLCGI